MGKPEPAPAYRGEPSDAVSMHTTPDDYDYCDVPHIAGQPPTYSDSMSGEGSASNAAHPGNPPPSIPDHYAVIDRSSSVYAFGKPVGRDAVSIRMDDRLTNPDELHDYIISCLRVLPPRPVVQIHGYHTQTVRSGDKRESKQIVDFDILLSLQHFLGPPLAAPWWSARTVENGESALRGSFRKTRAQGYSRELEVGQTKPELRDWCKEYCESPSALKIFRVSRTVSNLNYELIRQRLEALIRRTNYRGNIVISFSIEQRAVDIYSPHRLNRYRTTTWVRWLFYLTFLWIFAWPLLHFFTHRWAVYNVNWAFAVPDGGPGPDGRQRQRYATVSEEAWVARHAGLVRRLVVGGHRGDASGLDMEDELEDGRNARFAVEDARAGRAAGIVQAGLAGWNAVQSGLGVDTEGWGGDC